MFSKKTIVVVCLLAAGLQGCDTSGPQPTPTHRVAEASPTRARPTVVPTATLAGDGKIDAEGLFHDSRDPAYRSPGGPVEAGTDVVLRLRTRQGDLTGATVRLWDSRLDRETLVPMASEGAGMWEATVSTPAQGEALWYRLIAQDGSARAYYNDDRAADGGQGEGHLYESDSDFVITAYNPNFKTPAWVRDAVVYQIFPDRFYNGDPQNDKPTGSFFYGGKTELKQWGDKPTGSDDFFGGDLQGVTAKLDYLQSLGVTAIYFNPIFMSPSNHRYDTTDYTKIDPALGDLAVFRRLVQEARARGIHIILDAVFNHSSSDSLYFDRFARYSTTGAYESQGSPYEGWYSFKQWPDMYTAWSGISTLPQFTETEAIEQFLFKGPDSVSNRWLGEGIAGWRLDAAEQKSRQFWRDMRDAVKQADPEAVIVGEFWHNSAPWLAGDQWDGTMNYRFRDAVLGWLANPARDVETMRRQLDSIREDYPPQALAASMNLIDSHDTARALTEAGGDKNMLMLMALMQFTWPGMPTIYYGDEAGMEGRRDPDDRRTYPWGSEDQALIEYYKMLARTRHSATALQTGDYRTLLAEKGKDVYSYARADAAGAAIVALNRSPQDEPVTLEVGGLLSDGATLADQLNTGQSYTVQNGVLRVTVRAKWGILLLPKK